MFDLNLDDESFSSRNLKDLSKTIFVFALSRVKTSINSFTGLQFPFLNHP